MAAVTCATCSREHPASATICAVCGAALPRTCAGCGHANTPGSNFCGHCGLVLLGGATGASLQPRAYTPNHLVERILGSRSALEGERKQVTVCFIDVKESMQLAQRVDAEEWHRILDRFFAILADGIHRFEGTINQFTGDGVMALFGAPLAHEDHAPRACHAALYLREQLRLFAQELKRTRKLPFAVRMGLNSGEVIVGTIGDDLRMDYTAQGHTVGLAARMQQSAAAGTVYLTAHTAALVSSFFELAPVGRIRLKGVRESVRTFALVDARPIRTRLEASRARGFSRFVGRTDEVAVLEAALSRAMAGHGQVVGVVGAAGVGKSRLCNEVVDRWRAEGLAIAAAHCPAHGTSLPYAALRDLLRSFFGITPTERPTTGRRLVRGRLRRLCRPLEADLPLILDFLGVADAKRPLPMMDEATRRARLFAAVCGLVQVHSAHEPTVLLIDDAHWIDAPSNAFLAQLVQAVGWTRTLLLLNFRSDYAAEWMRTSYYQELQLSPLTAEATDALLRELMGDDPSLTAVSALVKEHAAGNPFFAEEIVRSLIDQGVVVRERVAQRTGAAAPASRMRLARPIAGVGIPATVQSLLAARIDRLPESTKRVLQTAAVIGKRFSEPVLRLALDVDGAPPTEASGPTAGSPAGTSGSTLAHALWNLQRADLIDQEPSRAPAEYVFKHPLTQEVAYHSLLQETRVQKHAAVARALEVVHVDRLGEHAALLAHHWEAASKSYEARLWRRRAALHVTNIQVRRDCVRARKG